VLRLGPVPEHLVAEILLQVVRGLAYVHSKGFIHRDLKPDNLLLYREGNSPPHTFADIFGSPDWRVSICDFGIAAGGASQDDEDVSNVIGSAAFMAPEQAFCVEKVDFRSDIYALGATAYFFLTGVAPFDGHGRDERLLLKAQNNIPDPCLPKGRKVSRQFLRILRRMGAVNQEERYQDYASLLADLEYLQISYDSRQKGLSPYFPGRQRSFFLGLGLGVVILLLALSAVLFHRWMLRLEEENSIPKTISMIFWEGARDQWRIFQRDVNCEVPTLIGNRGAGALTLREVLQPGQSIQVEVRLMGIGGASLQIVDAEGERASFFCHHLSNPELQLWRMEVDGQTMPLGQIQLNNNLQWTKVVIQVHKQQIWFHVNGELRGVRHLEKGIEQWRLRLGTVKGVYFQLKDLQVLGKRE
ncbi:MAG: serine/threonine protein kinase, partial [Oligosphaeraceae bacterium]|nr:serine/threonine protein kinase [Oligosphaeraceae bacterium]